jgi:hypothetical protein
MDGWRGELADMGKVLCCAGYVFGECSRWDGHLLNGWARGRSGEEALQRCCHFSWGVFKVFRAYLKSTECEMRSRDFDSNE